MHVTVGRPWKYWSNAESGLHVLRMRILTEILLGALIKRFPKYSVAPADVAVISSAAALHDVGKIVIPEEILNKPGRLTARELVESSIRTNPEQRSALFFIDVDNFKAANDGFGHSFGDRVLQHIAKTLYDSIRKTDIAARVGGDEFLLYLENMADSEKIREYAQRLLDTLATTYVGYSISISIGIARYPRDGLLYSDLLSHADQALYASKYSGKKRFAFYDEAGEALLSPTLLSAMDEPVRENGCKL